MMTTINFSMKKLALKKQGFHLERDAAFRLGLDLNEILKELDDISALYSDSLVETKLFRKRENHPGRKGDAVMSTYGDPKFPPYLKLQKYKNLMRLQMEYNNLVQFITKEDMDDSISLMNWQQYKQGHDNSLPYHMDVEIFDGAWEKQYIDIERGLIPKYVMVLVTENENDGAGLKVMAGNEEIDLVMHPGDLLIFDNTKVLHGVPVSTPNKRSMVGFRNFYVNPLYFQKTPENGEGLVLKEFQNGFVKGFATEISTEKAIEILKKENFIDTLGVKNAK